MEKKYWMDRWERADTGWHQTEVESGLVAHFSDLSPTRVLVPLCGKSRDLTWLTSQGHEVIGVELSELATQSYFEENIIPYEKVPSADFTIYQGGGVKIFQGDFFSLGAAEVGEIGAIYDRAALIALPPDLRKKYAARLIELVHACASRTSFRFLQIVLERTPSDTNGPPHSVSAQELDALYGAEFEIQPLSREPVDMGSSSGAQTEECVYQLVKKG